MLFSKRILVALEGGPHCLDAINRARLIAQNTDAELELLWFGTQPAWAELEDDIRVLEKQCSVRRLVSTRGLLEDVKRAWQADHFALLIKGCDLQHARPALMAPIDWQLLRETPCPVLLVKRPEPWANGPILAAVNPLSSKEHQLRHDQSVLKLASFIACETGGELQTVVATRPPMLAAEPESQSPMLIEQKARSATEEMLKDLKVNPGKVHLGEGPAEYWIAQVASEQEAALVVISTRARGGIKGALLGNTAEQILDRLDTDVMVLRPGLAEQLPLSWQVLSD